MGKRECEFTYGLAGPSYELFASNHEYINNSFVAEIAGAYGMDAVRIWVPHMAVAKRDGQGGYVVSLTEPERSVLKDQVQRLKEQGVKKIVACPTSHLVMEDYPIYVGVDGQAYSMEQVEELQLQGGYRDYYAVPNPITEPEAYQNFLQVQEDFFRILCEEIPDINYLEPINEPEHGVAAHPTGVSCSIAGWQRPEAYNEALIAKICMDYCRAATNGARNASNGAKVLCVALTGTKKGQQFLRECYEYMKGESDCTYDDFFEILNWHPYIFYTDGTDGPVSRVDDWDGWHEEWLEFQNVYYQIAVDAGDGNKPVWFTEFGVTDCGKYNTEEAQWPTGGPITGEMAARRLMSMIELAENRMPYVEVVFIFRITDLEDKYFPERSMSENFAYNYEANFGLVECFSDCTSGEEALKEVGKALYRRMHDGSTDYMPLYEMLNAHYNQANASTIWDDENAQFDSAVSGILLADPDFINREDKLKKE